MSTTKRSRSGSRSSKKGRGSSYKKAGTKVEVYWGDAWGTSGWSTYEQATELHGPLEVRCIGYVHKHDKKGITLCQGQSMEGKPLAIHFYPKGMIRKIKVLK